MTLQLDQRAREAVIHGPPRKLMDGAAPTVMENIAHRVAEAPDGLIRSFQADGTLREETFADVWRRSGDIAARLRSLDVGPRSQTVLLLRDLLDFVPCFWASLRVGATPIPFTGVAHAATAEELKNLVARLERPAVIADAPTPDLDRLAALLPYAPMLRLSSLSGKGDEGEYQELDGDEPDIVCLLPTSGSTGTVKLVMLDRRAMLLRNFSQNYSTASLNANVMNVFPFEGISGLSVPALCKFDAVAPAHPYGPRIGGLRGDRTFRDQPCLHDQFDGRASGRGGRERGEQFRSQSGQNRRTWRRNGHAPGRDALRRLAAAERRRGRPARRLWLD
jgi:hypothetical protein